MNNKPPNAYADMRQNFTTLAKDVLCLLDLQMQLFTLDVGEFWQRARFGIVFCIVGLAAMLASLPVFLLGLSEFVRTRYDLSMETAMVLVAGLAICGGAAALWLSVRQLTKAGNSLKRSQAELKANMTWLRSVISRDEE